MFKSCSVCDSEQKPLNAPITTQRRAMTRTVIWEVTRCRTHYHQIYECSIDQEMAEAAAGQTLCVHSPGSSTYLHEVRHDRLKL